MTMPMPTPQIAAPEANALWRNGSRAFFKDQRAAVVGDILTVLVNITDTADSREQHQGGADRQRDDGHAEPVRA